MKIRNVVCTDNDESSLWIGLLGVVDISRYLMYWEILLSVHRSVVLAVDDSRVDLTVVCLHPASLLGWEQLERILFIFMSMFYLIDMDSFYQNDVVTVKILTIKRIVNVVVFLTGVCKRACVCVTVGNYVTT